MNRRRLLRSTALTLAALASTAVGLSSALMSPPAFARDAAGERAALEGLLKTHVLPRFGALAEAAAAAVPVMARLGAQPDAATLKGARDAYGRVMDAWAAAQHLRPGPLLQEQRADRLFFWPDRRGVTSRQLTALLAKDDPAAAAVGKQSAAVQGLPALERLLFDDGVDAKSFTGDAGARRARLAAGVAANIAALTAQTRDGWTELAPALLAGMETTPIGKGAGEALNNLFLSLVTAMQIVVDQKLMIPLGSGLNEAKPALAEAARSGRSLQQIDGNLKAMRAMLLGEGGGPGLLALADEPARKEAAAKTAHAFDAALAALAAVSAPLDRAAADPKLRPKAEAALRAAKAAQNVVSRELPSLLGVTLGFNELDGD